MKRMQSRKPVDTFWVTLSHPNAPQDGDGNRKSLGKIKMSIEILPQHIADKRKNGNGREAPNKFPFLPAPKGRFGFVRMRSNVPGYNEPVQDDQRPAGTEDNLSNLLRLLVHNLLHRAGLPGVLRVRELREQAHHWLILYILHPPSIHSAQFVGPLRLLAEPAH